MCVCDRWASGQYPCSQGLGSSHCSDSIPAFVFPRVSNPSLCISSLSTSPDTEVRRRAVGAGPAQGEPSPPKEKQDPALTPWKPFLVNMCMATVLTAGAYLCYRVCFH